VFWDGDDPSPRDLLDRWREAVGFDDERHGTVRPGHNGPSGAGLAERILTPLGLSTADVAYTDAVPWFFVKHGCGSQGDAIRSRFAPVARQIGVHPGSLPERPTVKALPAIAAGPARRNTFRREILDIDAPVIISLGQEAIDALAAVADSCSGITSRLSPDSYGQPAEIVIEGVRRTVLPLAHPGFIRQTKDAAWVDAIAAWQRQPITT
jgi:hypothetical protein